MIDINLRVYVRFYYALYQYTKATKDAAAAEI